MLGWDDAQEAKTVLKEVSPKIKLWEQRNKIPDAIGNAVLVKGEAPWDWVDRQYKDSDKTEEEVEEESESEIDDEKEKKKKAKSEMSAAPVLPKVPAANPYLSAPIEIGKLGQAEVKSLSEISPVFDDADVCAKSNMAFAHHFVFFIYQIAYERQLREALKAHNEKGIRNAKILSLDAENKKCDTDMKHLEELIEQKKLRKVEIAKEIAELKRGMNVPPPLRPPPLRPPPLRPPPIPASSASSIGDPQLKTEKECVVCLTNDKQIRFEPCGHLCCCRDCDSKILSECPICRTCIAKRCYL